MKIFPKENIVQEIIFDDPEIQDKSEKLAKILSDSGE